MVFGPTRSILDAPDAATQSNRNSSRRHFFPAEWLAIVESRTIPKHWIHQLAKPQISEHWLRSACRRTGRVSQWRGARSGTQPERNALRRSADGSPPLLRLIADARS